jgi:hypothetical protein
MTNSRNVTEPDWALHAGLLWLFMHIASPHANCLLSVPGLFRFSCDVGRFSAKICGFGQWDEKRCELTRNG